MSQCNSNAGEEVGKTCQPLQCPLEEAIQEQREGTPLSEALLEKAFQNYDVKASHRVEPLPVISLEEVEAGKLFYSPDESPIARHPLIASRGSEAIRKVLALNLNISTAFTQAIEDFVVTPISMKLANQEVDAELPWKLRFYARHVAVDEEYHSLFTHYVEHQACLLTGIAPLPVRSPEFLRKLDEAVRKAPREFRALVPLFFTICSETLITGSLARLHKDERVLSGVRKMFYDHSADETLHSLLYAATLETLWEQMTPAQRRYIGPRLPDYILWFLTSDTQAWRVGLKTLGIGLSEAEIETILHDCFRGEQVVETARDAAHPSIHILTKKGLFKDSRTHEAFLKSGLLRK